MLVLVLIALFFWVHADSAKDILDGVIGLFFAAALCLIIIGIALAVMKS